MYSRNKFLKMTKLYTLQVPFVMARVPLLWARFQIERPPKRQRKHSTEAFPSAARVPGSYTWRSYFVILWYASFIAYEAYVTEATSMKEKTACKIALLDHVPHSGPSSILSAVEEALQLWYLSFSPSAFLSLYLYLYLKHSGWDTEAQMKTMKQIQK